MFDKKEVSMQVIPYNTNSNLYLLFKILKNFPYWF
jgi:hypothetical protein